MKLITPEAKKILEKILKIQINSYKRIFNDSLDEEEKMFLMQFQSSEDELKYMAEAMIKLYTDLIYRPHLITIAPSEEIATMRHILFRMEDEWLPQDSIGVRECWELFFYIEELRQPKLKYVTKLIKMM